MSQAKAITNKIVTDNYLQRTILKYLLISLSMLFLAYFFLIISITFNVSARKTLENTLSEKSSKVSNLEVAYLDLSSKIDKELAMSLGFVDTHNNLVVTRTTSRVATR